ncbi:LysR family transcriptional regulator [Hydrogenophaga sp.]|uniref:LysR family transcriptional regulator n=1 Tax=Hydrogenophaga sp. TaxID=1904254 RepID=UPI00286E3146|nr:LysR family transcriptional regulator [Hydrogenophaga sp.]
MNNPFLSTMARHFLAVAEARSITDAGLALHVAPSAVSRQVVQMEAAMGCALFERQARGMALTEAGERLLAWLTAVQRESELVQRQVQGLGPAAAQRLHLACTEGFTTAFMPDLMGRFRAVQPGARLYLRVGDAQQVDQWLQRGEVEVGLRFATRPVEGLRVVASAPSPIVAVCAANHPLARRTALTVADLVAHPLALPEGSSTVRQVLDSACALQGTHYEVACTGTLPTLIALVRQGGLVMLGSRMSVLHALADGSLRAVPVAEALFEQRRVQLLVRDGRAPAAVAQCFLDLAAAALAASEAAPGQKTLRPGGTPGPRPRGRA